MFKKFIDKLMNKDKQNDTLNKKETEIEDDLLDDEQDGIEEDLLDDEQNGIEDGNEEVRDVLKEDEVKLDDKYVYDNEEHDYEELRENKEDTLEKIQPEEPTRYIEKQQIGEEIEEEIEEEIQFEEPVEEIEEIKKEVTEKFNLFKRLKEGLSKTKHGITDKVENLLKSYKKIDEDLFEELEEILITADIGAQTTMEIVDDLRDRVKKNRITDPLDVKELLMKKLMEILEDLPNGDLQIEPSPAIILVVGVNGVGKTTSIGKMAYKFKSEGKKVLLAAGDTFRAAAIEQLDIWGVRVGVDVIKHKEDADPAAVIYDAIQAAKARKIDVLICDTAGRLHNKTNLMNELGKIFKIIDREYNNASKEILLVLDATTGQNAIQQAKAFKEVAQITGLVLTKLDGTAKGGVVVGISRELNIPVKLIGVGEKMEDLQEFNPKTFVRALFGEEE